jgi:hypothetical protein
MARCKRELHPAVFNLHKHALRASVSAFPQMQITVTYACTFNLYKNLIALWLGMLTSLISSGSLVFIIRAAFISSENTKDRY